MGGWVGGAGEGGWWGRWGGSQASEETQVGRQGWGS